LFGLNGSSVGVGLSAIAIEWRGTTLISVR
jgi:hypothetical protein